MPVGRQAKAVEAAVEQEEEQQEEEEEEEEGSDDDDDEEDEDEEDEEDEDDEEDDDSANLAAQREKRQTAGRRMQNLVGEEMDKDDTFWGNSKWNEDDAESEYLDSSDSADEVDADFDVSEDDDEEDEEEENDRAFKAKEKRKPKASKYTEPKRKAPAAKLSPEEAERLKQERKEAARLRKEFARLTPVDRAKRVSTQQKTEAATQAREVTQAKAKPMVARAPRISKSHFTQEELLTEACSTEQANAKWLLDRKRLQTESDTVNNAPKKKVKLASRFISRRGCDNIVNFPEVDLMPAILKTQGGGVMPHRQLTRDKDKQGEEGAGRKCVVTGLPAKYRDPLTSLPYATIEAFKAIRSGQIGGKAAAAGSRSRRGHHHQPPDANTYQPPMALPTSFSGASAFSALSGDSGAFMAMG